MNVIGHQTRKLRTELGYSQEYIARKLSITQSRYSEIENSNEEISLGKLNKIANILGKNPLDLIILNGYSFQYFVNPENSSSIKPSSVELLTLEKIAQALELLAQILQNKKI